MSKEELTRLYWEEDMTIREIAINFRTSHLCVLNYMNHYKIDRRDRKDMTSGKNHWKYSGDKNLVKCSNCSKEFKSNHMNRNDRFYCSTECYWKSMMDDLPPEHKRFLTRSKWKKTALKIRERDNWECQICGMTQEEHLEKYFRSLNVHHINPRKIEPKNAYDEDNLITLCRVCHSVEERKNQ